MRPTLTEKLSILITEVLKIRDSIIDLIPDSSRRYVSSSYFRLKRTIIYPMSRPSVSALKWLSGLETEKSLGRRIKHPPNHFDAFQYEPTPYEALAYIKPFLRADDVFVDLGSGMGRVVLYVAGSCKIRKVVGVEIDPELLKIARTRLSNLELRRLILSPVELIEGDAATVNLGEGTVYFLYNPFGESTLLKVLTNIRLGLATDPRHILIIYANALFAQTIDKMDWLNAVDNVPRLIPFSLYSKTSFRIWKNNSESGTDR